MLVDGKAIVPLVLALFHGAAVAVLAPRLHLAAAAWCVDTRAGVVLRVAGIGAALRHGGAGIGLACRRVFARVEFEWVAAPVRQQIVASEDGGLDVADTGAGRVAGAWAAVGQHADVCNGGGGDGSCRRWGLGYGRGLNRCWCADACSGGARAFLGRILRQAVGLVAIATSASVAVRLDICAPACELKALESFGP